MKSRIYCFDPIIENKVRVLILGTIPGVESLDSQTYYNHKSNHFWDIIYRILQSDYPPYKPFDFNIAKSDRYQLLNLNGVALWDVVSDCFRDGSNDSKIIDPKFNDIAGFIRHNDIRAVFCNGEKAIKLLKFSGQLRQINIPVLKMNSTSSSNPNNTFVVFQEWQQMLSTYFK